MRLQEALLHRRTAALLDLLQALTGFSLALFLWVHLLFVAAIFLGPAAFDQVPRALDAAYLSRTGVPAVLAIFFLHAFLAARKMPASWREQRVYWRHARGLGHRDTWAWGLQVITGAGILVLAAVHFWFVLTTWPIEAARSAFRVADPRYFVFYIALLLLGETHASAGLYRLAVKWGWPSRRRAGILIELLSVAAIAAGIAALVVLRRLGGAL